MKRANVTAVLFLCNIAIEITFVVGFVSGQRFIDLFGMTEAQLGLFFAGGNAGWIVCSFLAGHATHRWGVLPVLTAGLWASLAGIAMLMGANGFGMLRCLNAATGKPIWKYKTDHEVLSTPAVVKSGGKLLVLVGSADRRVHCIDAKSSLPVWKFETGKYVVSSPAVASLRGEGDDAVVERRV